MSSASLSLSHLSLYCIVLIYVSPTVRIEIIIHKSDSSLVYSGLTQPNNIERILACAGRRHKSAILTEKTAACGWMCLWHGMNQGSKVERCGSLTILGCFAVLRNSLKNLTYFEPGNNCTAKSYRDCKSFQRVGTAVLGDMSLVLFLAQRVQQQKEQ